MTAGQQIDYDALALEALRGVVKACLAQVARSGLLGDHHFYIAFNTQASGVQLSRRLKEKYPLEMTIVLQHRFWDLVVEDERFEVKLTFDGIPERLVIPFKAIKVFYDPSVPYGLQFEEAEPALGAGGASRRSSRGRAVSLPREGESDVSNAVADNAASNNDRADVEYSADRRRPARRSKSERLSDKRSDPAKPIDHKPGVSQSQSGNEKPRSGPSSVAIVSSNEADGLADDESGKEATADADAGAKIFDLSKFRQKK
jgi:uncharacterized protein